MNMAGLNYSKKSISSLQGKKIYNRSVETQMIEVSESEKKGKKN